MLDEYNRLTWHIEQLGARLQNYKMWPQKNQRFSSNCCRKWFGVCRHRTEKDIPTKNIRKRGIINFAINGLWFLSRRRRFDKNRNSFKLSLREKKTQSFKNDCRQKQMHRWESYQKSIWALKLTWYPSRTAEARHRLLTVILDENHSSKPIHMKILHVVQWRIHEFSYVHILRTHLNNNRWLLPLVMEIKTLPFFRNLR